MGTPMPNTIRRHYPSRPVEPHEYAAWRAVLERAERNGWYQGAADRAATDGLAVRHAWQWRAVYGGWDTPRGGAARGGAEY
jgi:hypothetical protein